jgi:large subunit ribosomal protein L18
MTKATGPTYEVPFRRRKEGRTRFDKRLAYVKSGLPRMVVRKSNKYVLVQFIQFQPAGDKCLLTVDYKKLKSCGWNPKRNVWSAYLAGLLAGKEAARKGVKEFVLDIGMQTPSKGSVLFAAMKGAVDSGLKASYDEKMIPQEKLANPPAAMKSAFEEAKGKISKN